MASIKQLVKELEASNEFKEWKQTHKDCYLAHAFNTIETKVFGKWQLGYFDKSSKKITVFEVESAKILAEDDILESGSSIKALDVENISINVLEALDISHQLEQDKYPKIVTSRAIIIIQNLDIGQVWNLTFVTNGLDVLNVKIDSKNRSVLEHSLKPFFRSK